MKTENMINGGSYTINPETEEVTQIESTKTPEEAAAEAEQNKGGKKTKQQEGGK